jgi:hypothetical protein
LDNILVASAAKHGHHLYAVFSLLDQSGLVVNTEKCFFGWSSNKCLGYRLSSSNTSPLSSGVEAVVVFPQPATVCHLQAFLGLFEFYRKFISAMARLVLLLARGLCGTPHGNQALVWSAELSAAFEVARRSLSSTAVLNHLIAEAELSLVTDASATYCTWTQSSSRSPLGRVGDLWVSFQPSWTRPR